MTSSDTFLLTKKHLGLLILTAIWLLVLLCFPISHNDTWWHLKCGQWLLQNKYFPAHDPFSYSSDTTTWLRASWLFEILAWKVYASWGAMGLVSAKLIVAMAAALIAIWYSLRQGASVSLSLGIVALAFLATRSSWTERPQTTAALSYVFAVVILSQPRGKIRNLALFTLSVLWANLNGSVILLPLYALAYEAGLWFERKGFSWKSVCLCFIGTFVSPQWGSEYLDTANFYGAKEAMRSLITEWHPPVQSFSSPLTWLFILSLLTLILAVRKRKWAIVLLLAVVTAGGFHVGRLAPFFAMTMAMLAPAFLGPSENSRNLWILDLALATLLIIHGSWMLFREPLWTGPIDTQQFPVQASEFLAQDPPIGNLGNMYRDGAYLLFKLGPQTKVFVDSREFNYPEKIFRAAVSLETGGEIWKKIAHDFNFTCIVLPRQSPLYAAVLRDPHWKLVYFDINFAIVATPGEILRHQGRWPQYPRVDLLDMTVENPTPQTTLALQLRLQRQAPDAMGYYLLGQSLALQGKMEAARQAYVQSLLLDATQDGVREALLTLTKQSKSPRTR